MSSDNTLFLRLIEDSLTFTWDCGACTPVAQPHTTGWRILPWLVTAHLVDVSSVLDTADGSQLLVQDETSCLPADLHHRLTLVGQTAGVSRWSHTRFTLFGGLDALRVIAPPLVLRGPAAREVGEINAQLAVLADHGITDLRAISQRKALGFTLLRLVAEQSPVRPAGLDLLRGAQRLAPVLTAVDVGLGDEEFDLASLARIAGLSPSRFHAVFREALGMAPSRWLQQRRLARARELLLGSELPVNVVAARAGFGDPFHFSRLFKRIHGIAPLAYRGQPRGF